MNRFLIMLACMLPLMAQAQIFVCKDSKNQLTYQDEPCLNKTLRTLKHVPDAPIEDQISARERIERANAQSQERAVAAELERQQQQKEYRELQAIAIEKQKLELLESQTLASEQYVIPPWILGVRPAHRFGQLRPYANRGRFEAGGNRSGFNRSRQNRQRNHQEKSRQP